MPGYIGSTDLGGAGGLRSRVGNTGRSPYETMKHAKEKGKKKKPKKIKGEL